MSDTEAPQAAVPSEDIVQPLPDFPVPEFPAAAASEPIIIEPAVDSAPASAPAAFVPEVPASAPEVEATSAPVDDKVRFNSASPEDNEFEVMGIYPRRDDTRRYLIWEMDAETAERFERHYFVVSGRIFRQG